MSNCRAEHPNALDFHSEAYGTTCRRRKDHKGKHRGTTYSVDTGKGQPSTGHGVTEWEAPDPR